MIKKILKNIFIIIKSKSYLQILANSNSLIASRSKQEISKGRIDDDMMLKRIKKIKSKIYAAENKIIKVYATGQPPLFFTHLLSF